MYCAAKQGRQVVWILIYSLIHIFYQPTTSGRVWIGFNLDVLLLKEAGNAKEKITYSAQVYMYATFI